MSEDLLQQGRFALDLLEAAPDAIVTVDGDGRVIFVNAEAEALFGYARDELLGASVEELIPGANRAEHRRHREAYRRSPRKRPMGAEIDLWALTRDGREIPVEISLSPHETPEGFFVSAAIRDVTRRRETEAELMKARNEAEQADHAKTRFLAAASHDLRQPLQAAILYANVLQRQVEDGAVGETVAKLQRSLEALQGLLNRLLDVSRLDAQAVKPEKMSFSVQLMLERLTEELSPLADEKGIRLRMRPDEAWIYSDPQLLERLLRNLISNAIRYTERGGVLIGCRHRGEELAIQVWDTGIGIPEKDQARIFDEFFQVDNPARRRQSGLELGLAIVQRLSALLDHPVAFRSTVARGSVFEVT
ncbi:MAG: PAS domain-containing sensor histidine kinase, partial [Thermoanaerobaculia bacterium]|nr:PAS domain-containing sensor histidine kinase [Thermoanaerobaculia bacterium]